MIFRRDSWIFLNVWLGVIYLFLVVCVLLLLFICFECLLNYNFYWFKDEVKGKVVVFRGFLSEGMN